jgi:P pilus assembly/Cpx signaling pathway, periplasmic inhibitor/zinc-resistance associated protein
MNYFLKLRYAIWIIIVLSVIILATVGSMLYFTLNNSQHQVKNDDVRRRPQMEQFFRKELGLTPDQDKKASEFRKEFFKSAHAIFDSIEKKRIAMIEELSKPNPDTVVLYKLADEMGDLHARLKRGTIQNLMRLRSICTPEQVQKLNKLNKDIIRPEGPGRRGPRRDSSRAERPEQFRGQHPQ